ncbi:hypothetical protein [Dietzia sp. 179-F 9C3 NHS]|uniref:hypothetical protein n=1 Tax=Dietzia sp. 179-F 9C3 NHS TaxID=3374295 RepID=UPI00387A6F3E
MTAVSLNISGLYLGTAVAGAIGGLTLDHLGASAIPIVGAIALVAAWLVAAPAIPTRTEPQREGAPQP